MGNNLSQDEINALLAGVALGDTSSEGASEPAPEPPGAMGESAEPMQSAEAPTEAANDAGEASGGEYEPFELKDDPGFENALTPEEKDAMGEIGNISMGTSATTLSMLLNKKVDITTPHVIVTNMKSLAEQFPLPFVSVQVTYTKGLEGNSLLFLRPSDVKIITDLMMGGDGTNTAGTLGDLHLSAISEAMNQMVGSSSTSLSQMIGQMIDISPPAAKAIENVAVAGEPIFSPDQAIIVTVFDMEVQGLIHSQIMQIMPLEFGRDLLTQMMSDPYANEEPAPAPAPAPPPPPPPPAPAPAAPARAPAARPAPAPKPERVVSVEPVQYQSFDDTAVAAAAVENLDILLDVPLQVSVELGKSRKYVKEILDFNIGSVVVLDKQAGEMVDIYVNGKLIAKGEVVVIEDSYGARITEIVNSSARLGDLM